jgi:hypothetical protein
MDLEDLLEDVPDEAVKTTTAIPISKKLSANKVMETKKEDDGWGDLGNDDDKPRSTAGFA